jgi:FKBP-type peptidyl-prolyl cis-trans isomerase SlyD
MEITDDAVVSIHYTLTNDAGEELDSSSGGDPLTYLHGRGGLIPGLERQLDGKTAGEALQATVQPEEAYGISDPALIEEVSLDLLSHIENLAPGMQLQSRGPDGQTNVITIDAVGEATAVLNANHALAGEVLHFDVEVVDVRAATEEELAHGHAH